MKVIVRCIMAVCVHFLSISQIPVCQKCPLLYPHQLTQPLHPPLTHSVSNALPPPTPCVNLYTALHTVIITLTLDTPVSTSVPGDSSENDCKCSEDPTVIAVSAVSLLLIVTLTTVILTQCLLIIRMRRSSRDKTDTYAEVTNPTTKTTDVSVFPNEAYALHKITTEEVSYEMVK